MASTYHDRSIECDDDAIRIRGYYFPWGTKTIAYSRVRGVRRAPVTLFGGRGRLWGSTTGRNWANLDVRRPGKQTALVIDTGRPVKPFITPDDVDAAAAAILAHAPIDHIDEGPGPALV